MSSVLTQNNCNLTEFSGIRWRQGTRKELFRTSEYLNIYNCSETSSKFSLRLPTLFAPKIQNKNESKLKASYEDEVFKKLMREYKIFTKRKCLTM